MRIENAKIIYPDRIEEGAVRVEGEKIAEINPCPQREEEVVDAQGMYLSPGFIDIHIHGAGGRDIMEGSEEAVNVVAKAIAAHGTTSFVPTTMTEDAGAIRKAVALVSRMKNKRTEGANVLGIHLEGPFVNPKKLGAQNPKYARLPSVEAVRDMIGGYEASVLTVTLAPELPGSIPVIRYLAAQGIHVSMGHTDADYGTAMEAIKAGVSHATHLYNAMSPLRHRDPGVVAAVFESGITTEFIADGIHIDYPALRIAMRQKGTDAICLITDAMMGCTMPEGKYMLGGQEVWLAEGMAKLRDGTFAGTLLTLDEAVRQLKDHTEYPLYEIVKMATWNPARYCGVEDRKGRIAAGYDADFLLFDDNIAMKKVVIGGKCVFSPKNRRINP